MIKSFRHKGLKALFEKGETKGVRADHVRRLELLLAQLDAARSIDDMGMPGWGLHPLKGQGKGRWAVSVNGNWRVTFAFVEGDAYVLDYEDYH